MKEVYRCCFHVFGDEVHGFTVGVMDVSVNVVDSCGGGLVEVRVQVDMYFLSAGNAGGARSGATGRQLRGGAVRVAPGSRRSVVSRFRRGAEGRGEVDTETVNRVGTGPIGVTAVLFAPVTESK